LIISLSATMLRLPFAVEDLHAETALAIDIKNTARRDRKERAVMSRRATARPRYATSEREIRRYGASKFADDNDLLRPALQSLHIEHGAANAKSMATADSRKGWGAYGN
jgi:hypothetical protein